MIIWTQNFICLDRDSFKLFYFLDEHLRNLFEIYVLPYDLSSTHELDKASKMSRGLHTVFGFMKAI